MGADVDDGHLHSHTKDMKARHFDLSYVAEFASIRTGLCMTVILTTTQNWWKILKNLNVVNVMLGVMLGVWATMLLSS